LQELSEGGFWPSPFTSKSESNEPARSGKRTKASHESGHRHRYLAGHDVLPSEMEKMKTELLKGAVEKERRRMIIDQDLLRRAADPVQPLKKK
jgi:hypothetical protein